MARTVRVYNNVIETFADDPSDPIGITMDFLADEIREAAEENARVIIPSLPFGILHVESGKDTKGLFFRVFLDDDEGKFSKYLARKETREHAWFEPAVAEVLGAEALRIGFF